MAPPRILIVGTAGQLATELHRQRAAAEAIVLPPQRVDVSDAESVAHLLDESQPDLVLNASAYTAVDRAESERERAFAVNAEGPRQLALWCKKKGAALVHISTDYVFDGLKPAPYTEGDATGPLNVYGRSKLEGEQAIRDELERHLILRTSWVFSAHGQNFVKTIRRLAREREELKVVADQRGRPTSAADLASALWRLLRPGFGPSSSFPWGTYHLANAGATTWHALACAIVDHDAKITGRRPQVVPIPASSYPTPAPRPMNSVLDTTRFETTFGFHLRPFGEALSEALHELDVANVTPA